MDEVLRKRYQELKKKNKETIEKKEMKKNILLNECLEALENRYCELNKTLTKNLFDLFYNKVPITWYGRVEWDNISIKYKIEKVDEIINIVNNNEFYIIWGEGLPILKTDIKTLINYIDYILAVEFDTWLFSIDYKEIIEFYHEGEIIVGYM
ncbi:MULTISPECIES: hypothetical protein [Clostridium]|uniref:CDI toxin immunity protein n=1 Tax=Clostridium TaxID=1485 RepID=UPI00140047C5|nr:MULTISPECIES: hypothetical protein [Clostridium]MBY6915750.1 hypothetical protein [Clostridium botulinum]NFI53327.1 hypothetical protein [Clostridium botulinum]NFO39240.1 hypothetical protein [Clostridium botulinum]NFQ40217.1 hypothetical protein [Clostridium botulinum]